MSYTTPLVVFSGTIVHSFGLISALSSNTQTLVIPGVQTGDIAYVVRPGATNASAIISAEVTTSNTVTISATNTYPTENVTVGSQTYRVIVFRFVA